MLKPPPPPPPPPYGKEGGLTNDRPGSDQVTWGPMRGLDKNYMKRGHQTDRQTDRLCDCGFREWIMCLFSVVCFSHKMTQYYLTYNKIWNYLIFWIKEMKIKSCLIWSELRGNILKNIDNRPYKLSFFRVSRCVTGVWNWVAWRILSHTNRSYK